MKPIKFKESNTEFAKNQPQYDNLPALVLEGTEGYTVFCWKANFFERIQILFTGKVWVNIITFKKPLMPSYVSAFRYGMFSKQKDSRLKGWLCKLLTKK